MFIWEERNQVPPDVLRHNELLHLNQLRFDLETSSSRKGHMNRSIVRWGLLSLLLLSFASASYAQIAVGISVRFGPPAIPVYAQPICPGPGYFWTPGYWAWNDEAGYYWVPGTWVVAPVGMYWTPGYWGWGGGLYMWHAGYWGPHVGFYGGINYGFGYSGVGFYGGEWRGGGFYYNRSVTNVSVTNVTNVYNRTVVVNNVNRVSYNGGEGGIQARPTRDEERWDHERHAEPLGVQMEHERAAEHNRENFASENHGRPVFAATARPADFSRRSAVAARAAGGDYHPPAMSPRDARVNGPANRGNFNNNAPRNNERGNDGFRPFTPPSKGGANDRSGNPNFRNDNPRNNNSDVRGNPNRNNDNRNFENRNNNSNRNEMRNNDGRPTNQPHQNARPENAPRENQRNANPPQRQERPNSPGPKEERRR